MRTDYCLSRYLRGRTPLAEESASWAGGAIKLRVRAFLTTSMPPLAYVTSSRCLVLRGETVLVQRDLDSTHILPGGRREADETPLETVQREVLEETGWKIADPALVGFVHFTHLTPKPPSYRYPYPDFLQVVYVADADHFLPDARLDDGYEVESLFLPIPGVRALALTATQRLFLDVGLRERGLPLQVHPQAASRTAVSDARSRSGTPTG